MAVRLVIKFHAASGKGVELAQAMKARCEVSRQQAVVIAMLRLPEGNGRRGGERDRLAAPYCLEGGFGSGCGSGSGKASIADHS